MSTDYYVTQINGTDHEVSETGDGQRFCYTCNRDVTEEDNHDRTELAERDRVIIDGDSKPGMNDDGSTTLTLTIKVDDPEAVEVVTDAVNEALNTLVTAGWLLDYNDNAWAWEGLQS